MLSAGPKRVNGRKDLEAQMRWEIESKKRQVRQISEEKKKRKKERGKSYVRDSGTCGQGAQIGDIFD